MSGRACRVLALVAALSASVAGAEARKPARPAAMDAAARAQVAALFQSRIEQYLELQKKQQKEMAPLPDKATPEQIAAYEAQLAERMKAIRKGAKQGEIFCKQVEPLVRQIATEELKGADDAPARKSVAEGNPRLEAEPDAKPVQVAVNGNYTDAPVATTPPSFLMKLPPLPEQLSYRFVGRHLTLRDNESGLVVDYLLNVAPPLPTAPAKNK
jgi:hypothetical protein